MLAAVQSTDRSPVDILRSTLGEKGAATLDSIWQQDADGWGVAVASCSVNCTGAETSKSKYHTALCDIPNSPEGAVNADAPYYIMLVDGMLTGLHA